VELLVIRHAEPVHIEETADGSPADPPLHARGILQAHAVAKVVASEGIDTLISSPLRRALETAAAIGATTGLNVQVDEGVAEFDRGAASYVPMEVLKARRDPRLERWAGGDLAEFGLDPAAFQATVVKAVDGIAERSAGKTVAIVCHGGVINGYVAAKLGSPSLTWAFHDYTGITRLAISRRGTMTVRCLNERSHLAALTPTG
jgi:probable phosphoglycerate mutase